MAVVQILSPADGLAVHHHLMDADPAATRDLIHLYLEPLLDHINGRFPAVAAELRQQAVHDALLALCHNPHSYDPTRDPDLFRYLRRSAEGDLFNALRTERSRRRREILVGLVEDRPTDGNGEEDDPPHRMMAEEHQRWLRELFDRLEATLPAADRCVLRLLRQGESRTDVFAEALGAGHLCLEDRRRAVKQAKDRVKKHLRREGIRHERPI
jgi:hypothetical protein